MSKVEIQELLTRHWGLDEQAAESASGQINRFGGQGQLEAVVSELDDDMIATRDAGRISNGDIFSGRSNEKIGAIAECSADKDTNYDRLFDCIVEIFDEIRQYAPHVRQGARITGFKPRTRGGHAGLGHSLKSQERAILVSIFKKALKLGLATFTEITNVTQLGAYGPYLTGAWVGARDMQSTAIRSGLGAYSGIPALVKNGQDGRPETVRQAIASIRMNSVDNEDTGVDLGNIARTADHPGISLQILPVGEANKNVAIIARGRNLTAEELQLGKEERRQIAITHLSSMCIAGKAEGSAVFIDGSHDVPKMIDVNGGTKKDPDRILGVLEVINAALEVGEIKSADQIGGFWGEVGIQHGRTDPNYIISTKEGRRALSQLLTRTMTLIPPRL